MCPIVLVPWHLSFCVVNKFLNVIHNVGLPYIKRLIVTSSFGLTSCLSHDMPEFYKIMVYRSFYIKFIIVIFGNQSFFYNKKNYNKVLRVYTKLWYDFSLHCNNVLYDFTIVVVIFKTIYNYSTET